MLKSIDNNLRKCLIVIAVCCWLVSATSTSSGNPSGPSQSEPVYKPSDLSKKPAITSQPNAEYTQEALQNQVSGIVYVWVVLRASGEVSDIKLRSGLPFGLSERAMEAARKVKFEPGEKDGVAVSVRTILKYEFKLPKH